MPKLGFKLWFRKVRRRFNLYQLSRYFWNTFLALGLPILGIWLAYTANNIANASFELAKNDTSQQSQITQLKEVISNQKVQIDTLIKVSRSLQRQNELSLQQYKELTIQGKKIGQQLSISESQQNLTLQISYQERKGYFNKLHWTFREIETLSGLGKRELVTYSSEQRMDFMKKLKFLLEKEFENRYLLENQEAFEQWFLLYNNVAGTISSKTLNMPTIVVTDSGQHSASKKELKDLYQWEWEKIILERYFKFISKMYNTLIPKGFKEFNIKVYEK